MRKMIDELTTTVPESGRKVGVKRTLAQLRRTAYHHAGHAVAAILLGRTYERVEISPRDGDGRTGRVIGYRRMYDPLLGNQTRANRLHGVRESCIDLAAPVVNAMFTGHVERKRGGVDFKYAFGFCRMILPDESSNEEYTLLDTILAHTITLFSDPQVWSAVSAIAEKLVSNYEISFDEVREIVEKQTAQPRSGRHGERNDFEVERARSKQFLRGAIRLAMRQTQGSSR